MAKTNEDGIDWKQHPHFANHEYVIRTKVHIAACSFEVIEQQHEYLIKKHKAPVFIDGFVKWDGCSDLELRDEGCFHLCGPKEWVKFNCMMVDLFATCKKEMLAAAEAAGEETNHWFGALDK